MTDTGKHIIAIPVKIYIRRYFPRYPPHMAETGKPSVPWSGRVATCLISVFVEYLMSDITSLIGDYLRDEGLVVTNPLDNKAIATIQDYSVQDVERTVGAAHRARPSWAGRTGKERSRILRAWFDLIGRHADTLAAIVTAECGKPFKEAQGEVAYGASFIEWFAEEAKRVYGDVVPTHAAGKRILVTKEPIGVVSAITPWNFPIAMITRKVGPALAAGCSILVKPAANTPLSALALEKLAHDAGVPADVFRVVPASASAAVGKVLTTHPLIRKISFTGSTGVGKTLLAQAASTVKKASMELGGNAPFIVFDDADIDAAVAGAMASKYRNAGQTCVCANRFFVQEGIYDTFVARLTAAVEALKVGDGAAAGIEIGPLIDARALEGVERLVNEAVEAGARLVTGGRRHGAGPNHYAPTVLADVTHDMAISGTEVFGPVAPITRFRTEEEVVAWANDTPYGLAAYFYTRDMARTIRVMEALEYGMVGVNEGIISTEVAPFGGVKESGIGREGSRYGIDEYLEVKYCLLGGL